MRQGSKMTFDKVPVGGRFSFLSFHPSCYIKTVHQQALFNDFFSNAKSTKGLGQIWVRSNTPVVYYA